jgi:hypothetical protein
MTRAALELHRAGGDPRRVPSRQHPADDGGGDRHGDHDEEQVAPGDVVDDVRQSTFQRVRVEPSGQPDVGGHRPEQRAEEGEAAGGDRRQGAPGARAGAGGGQRAQLARRLAADEADAHGQDAEGERDGEHGGPVHDLGEVGASFFDSMLRLLVAATAWAFVIWAEVIGLFAWMIQPSRLLWLRKVQPAQRTLGDQRVRRIRARGQLALFLDDRVGDAPFRVSRCSCFPGRDPPPPGPPAPEPGPTSWPPPFPPPPP